MKLFISKYVVFETDQQLQQSPQVLPQYNVIYIQTTTVIKLRLTSLHLCLVQTLLARFELKVLPLNTQIILYHAVLVQIKMFRVGKLEEMWSC